MNSTEQHTDYENQGICPKCKKGWEDSKCWCGEYADYESHNHFGCGEQEEWLLCCDCWNRDTDTGAEWIACDCGQTKECDECNARYEAADPSHQRRDEDFFQDYLPRLHRDYPEKYAVMKSRLMKSIMFDGDDYEWKAPENYPYYDEEGHDIKCAWCNARWCDKKNENGLWVHNDCE